MKKPNFLVRASTLSLATMLLIAACRYSGAQDTTAATAQVTSGDKAGKLPVAGTTIVHPRDGALMVYVPAGSFTMGVNAEEANTIAHSFGYKDYRAIAGEEWFPTRQVFVEGFFVDKYEVTLEQWNKFVGESGYKAKLPKGPTNINDGTMELFPAVNIMWAEAQRYANWAHKSLPYEAQWEKAARGTDGRLYPWGNETPTPERGVFVDLKTNKETRYQMVGTKPAGASPYGCHDMAGNAYEWTSEWLEPYPNNPEADKIASAGHQFGCLRGGSFYHSNHAYSSAKRMGFEPDETYYHVGFRTVWTPPAGFFEGEEFTKATARVAERTAELNKLREAGRKAKPPESW